MATSVEYGLIAALIGVAIVGATLTVNAALEDTEQFGQAEGATFQPDMKFDDPRSPILVMTPSGPIVECPLGTTPTPRARPLDSRQAASCEPAT